MRAAVETRDSDAILSEFLSAWRSCQGLKVFSGCPRQTYKLLPDHATHTDTDNVKFSLASPV